MRGRGSLLFFLHPLSPPPLRGRKQLRPLILQSYSQRVRRFFCPPPLSHPSLPMIIDLIIAGVSSGNRVLLPPPRGAQKKRDCFRQQQKPPPWPVPGTTPKRGGSGGSFLRGGLSRPRWILFKRSVREWGRGSSQANHQSSGETVGTEARSQCKEIQITLCVAFNHCSCWRRRSGPVCHCQPLFGPANVPSLHPSSDDPQNPVPEPALKSEYLSG